MQIQQRSNKPQNSPRKRLTKIFTQELTSIHFFMPVTEKSEECKTI